MKTIISKLRVSTKTEGVFYKEIFNDKGKAVNKKFIIRWIDENGKDRLKSIGNYSAGIREKYCKAKREEIITKIRLGEELPHIAKPKQTISISEMSELYYI
ncbi:MAG: hypothetical protein U9N33_05360 [Campylobacterota bacterium]|nr:hypothetical protein [Campylobacterota bacterium]